MVETLGNFDVPIEMAQPLAILSYVCAKAEDELFSQIF